MSTAPGKKKRNLVSAAVHSGELTVPGISHPVSQPIYQTTAFSFKTLEEVDDVMSQASPGYFYYRVSTPNQVALEQAIARLEGAEAAYTASSGMGAIFAALIGVLQKGDHLVADEGIYGSTLLLITSQLSRFGIEASFVDIKDLQAVRAAVRPNTRVIYFETIGNPLLQIADLEALAKMGRELGVLTFVDGTFSSPAIVRPVEWGIDLVMHATTKYIGGHSDALGGVVAGSQELIAKARQAGQVTGVVQGPFDSWLNLRSLKTLPLRMAAHSRNALQVARWMEGQTKLSRVIYPGLPSHPQHELALKQMPDGCSGMLSFEIEGGLPAVSRFIKHLELVQFVPSLADVTSTISHPVTTSHRPLTPEARKKLGISDGLLRLSVGIEEIEDILEDLDNALRAV